MIIRDEQVTTAEVRRWQGLHLLHFQGSTCSQKVRLLLGELGLDWQSHPFNLVRHDNHEPWFLGINPRGVVPVLVHDGVVHVESNDILCYLDETFSGNGASYLFPPESEEAVQAARLLDMEDSLHAELRLLTIQFGPLSLKKDKEIQAQADNGAADESRDHEVRWWRDKLASGIMDEETREAVQRFRNVCDQLDQRLAGEDWLVGGRLSIVDISWYVNLQRLVRLGYPLARHPHLADLYERMRARPAFRADAVQVGSRVSNVVFNVVRFGNRLAGKDIRTYL